MNPETPATIGDLMNAIAELNSRMTVTLELPDWLVIGVIVLMTAATMALAFFAWYWISRWVEDR